MALYNYKLGVSRREIAVEYTLGTADTKYIPVPGSSSEKFTLKAAYTAIDAALTTADETIVVKNGATTLGTITITQSGSAAGDVDSATLSGSSASFAGGDVVTVSIGGENGSATKVLFVLSFVQNV